MYSGHMPFGQIVMNEEQIFNAAVSLKLSSLINVHSCGTIIVHSNCRHESIFTGNPVSVWLIDYRKRS